MKSEAWVKYIQLCERSPELLRSGGTGEIRILTAPADVQEVEQQQRLKLAQYGNPEEWATVGLVFEDQYIRVLRDAVEFPGGVRGTYIRVLQKRPGFSGVCVVPSAQNGVLLVHHFRHATREWHWEAPRGFAELAESCEACARRELLEEIGAEPLTLVPLGGVHTSSGLLDEYVVCFFARIGKAESADQSEGIREVKRFDADELRRMVSSREITDAITLSALFLASGCGLLKL